MPTEQTLSFRQIGLLILGILLFGLFAVGSHPASANLFHPPVDKFMHIAVFGLMAMAIQTAWPQLRWQYAWLAVVAIGGADELHQYLVPGRQPGWDDGIADMIGASIGLTAWKLSPWKTR